MSQDISGQQRQLHEFHAVVPEFSAPLPRISPVREDLTIRSRPTNVIKLKKLVVVDAMQFASQPLSEFQSGRPTSQCEVAPNVAQIAARSRPELQGDGLALSRPFHNTVPEIKLPKRVVPEEVKTMSRDLFGILPQLKEELKEQSRKAAIPFTVPPPSTEILSEEEIHQLVELIASLLICPGLLYNSLSGLTKVHKGRVNHRSAVHFEFDERLRKEVGHQVEWPEPKAEQELQVADRTGMKIYHGDDALRRLTILAPSSFTFVKTEDGVRRPIALVEMDEKRLIFRVTLQALQRSFAGAQLEKGFRYFLKKFSSPEFRVPRHYVGALFNARHYECVCQVHSFFRILSKGFPQCGKQIQNLGIILVSDMLSNGDVESSCVTAFKKSLEELLTEPQTKLGEFLFSLPHELRVILYRSRRIFFKRVKDLSDFARQAADSFCGKPFPLGITGWERLRLYLNTRLKPWLEINKVKVSDAMRRVGLHCSKATIFFPRSKGGGVAERNLVVGLWRLSQGKASEMKYPFGQFPRSANFDAVLEFLEPTGPARDEIIQAANWWLNEVVPKLPVVRQILSILPKRENKPRTFVLLDWATQQGCLYFKEIFRLFFMDEPFCKEAFAGMDDSLLNSQVREKKGDTMLSLDSKFSTDGIAHETSNEIINAVAPYTPTFAVTAAKLVYSPFYCQTARERPHIDLGNLSESHPLGDRLPFTIKMIDHEADTYPQDKYLHSVELNEPLNVPVFDRLAEIRQALREHGRVMLKSPTGTGKTVLAAGAFRSIITFQSIQALLLFRSSCEYFKIHTNLYYSRRKGNLIESGVAIGEDGQPVIQFEEHVECDSEGVPFTILTTEVFLLPLVKKYPRMLAVIDEADSMRSQTVFNCYETKRLGIPTLLMTATPEHLREDAHVVALEGTTRFPIRDAVCTFKELGAVARKAKTLICTYSEPHCHKLSKMFPDKRVLVLDSSTRKGDTTTLIAEAEIIISTSVVRASITIPDIVQVIDLGLVYREIDLPLNGFKQLVLFEATVAERRQLRGRVGRVSPGTSYVVSGVPREGAQLSEPCVLDRPSCMADSLWNIVPESTNQKIGVTSLIIEHCSRKMIGEVTGSRPNNFRPQILDLIESFDCDHPQAIAISVLLEESMIPSQLFSMRENPKLEAAWKFRSDPSLDPVTSALKVWKELDGLPFFEQEKFLITRWTANLDPSWDETLTEQDLIAISIYWWRRIAEFDRRLIGVFRDFSSLPAQKLEKAKYLCWDVRFENEIPQTLRAVKIDSIFPLVRTLISRTFEIPRMKPSAVTLRFVKNNRGPARPEVDLEGSDESRIYTPSDLPRILLNLKKALKDSAWEGEEPRLTTTGSPMSCTLSFSILNTLCAAASFTDKTWSRGFGDDLISKGDLHELREIDKAREDLGLMTKAESTGYGRVGSDAIAVFTERFWSLKDLEPIKSIKPQGLVYLYRALRPKHVIGPGQIYLPDYNHLLNSRSRDFPFLREIEPDSPNMEVPVRQTPLRSLLAYAFAQSIRPVDNVCSEADTSFVTAALESALLPLIPSTRGTPDRVLFDEQLANPNGTGPRISSRDAARATQALEGTGFWTPLHLRKFQPTMSAEQFLLSQARTNELDSASLIRDYLRRFNDDEDA